MNKKYYWVISIIVTVIILIVLIPTYKKSNYIGTPLEPINKLVKISYFGKGSYEDYKKLLLNPNVALSEEEFKESRKYINPEEEFKYGAKNKNEVMKNMKFIQDKNNKNLGKVYYVKDTNDSNIDSSLYWVIENKDGKWLIKND